MRNALLNLKLDEIQKLLFVISNFCHSAVHVDFKAGVALWPYFSYVAS